MPSMIELNHMEKKGRALVVFGDELPKFIDLLQYQAIFDAKKLVEPGSIYEATDFVESLAKLSLPNGTKLPKAFLYKGYELWWTHYNDLFYYFGLPFAQYKKLLKNLEGFESVDLHEPQFEPLFRSYLEGYGVNVNKLPGKKKERILPFGVFIQILITKLSFIALIFKRPQVLVFAGDKFEQGKDFDFRMRFVYKELRDRKIQFFEFIRSLEPWRIVVSHAQTRMRPIIYSEAVLFKARFLSFITGGHSWGEKQFGINTFASIPNGEMKFKLLVGTHYLRVADTDVWAIRLSQWIIKSIGPKAAYFSAATDRDYPAVIGCKLNNVPTAGILHGVASKYYNGYDFLPGFNGEKPLSLDKYGVWSDWWKEYYIKHGSTYKPDQLFVSGPMRPLEKNINESIGEIKPVSGPIKVLFVSEQLAVPEEVVPYIHAILDDKNLEAVFIFRQFGDGFKEWLMKNMPEIFHHPRFIIATGSLARAIEESEVAVGSHSTATLEMLLRAKVPIFFQTNKWGDYYSLKEYDENKTFFAENPQELIQKIKNSRSVSKETLLDLQKRYFGDPYQNGSKWLVDQLISFLQQRTN